MAPQQGPPARRSACAAPARWTQRCCCSKRAHRAPQLCVWPPQVGLLACMLWWVRMGNSVGAVWHAAQSVPAGLRGAAALMPKQPVQVLAVVAALSARAVFSKSCVLPQRHPPFGARSSRRCATGGASSSQGMHWDGMGVQFNVGWTQCLAPSPTPVAQCKELRLRGRQVGCGLTPMSKNPV